LLLLSLLLFVVVGHFDSKLLNYYAEGISHAAE
jgi:hypothetical protein